MQQLEVVPVIGEVGRYHVRSAAAAERMYLVDLDAAEIVCGHWCGCMHFEIRIALQLVPAGECKHIQAVRAYLEGRG